jgi:hypothetical protein
MSPATEIVGRDSLQRSFLMIPDLVRGSAAAALILAVLGLGACAGNTLSSSPAPQVPERFASVGRAKVFPTTSCASTACIYVTNSGADTVTVYPASANGNVAPIETISGSNTGLNNPEGIALDARLNINVANANTPSVTVYAAGANGNVAPIRAISGSNTELNNPFGIALVGKGKTYVVNSPAGRTSPVTAYAAGANGNVAPIQTISVDVNAVGIAFDASGNAYVASQGYLRFVPARVRLYAKRKNGKFILVRTISGPNTGLNKPEGIALDTSLNISVANANTPSVTVYATFAGGNVAPIRTISGSNTRLGTPYGIALDPAGNTYVANRIGSVTVYAAGANGNVAPIQIISGLNTGLNSPDGIAIH